MTPRFNGKRAVVTGAGSGIGAATARRLHAEGAAVIALDRNPIETGVLPDDARMILLTGDVTASDTAANIVDGARLAADERIDFLINNAGIGGARSIDETSDEDWQRFMDTNVTAAFRLTRDLLPRIAAPGGRIVNISSIYGLVGFPGSLAYGVAKAGIAQLTRQTAVDLAPRGILVNAIAPGVIETGMTRRRIAEDAWYQRIQIDATPVGRVGTPEDIAGVIAFLCSEDAAFIAGQVIPVDGGWLATRYMPRED
jgi:meso-butanediol dehydrogenase/(S,S)-butanediol dehydrogenase/diacetyl reductase